jgi:hypothetical protein
MLAWSLRDTCAFTMQSWHGSFRRASIDQTIWPAFFPASSAGAAIAASGYGNVWIRDNVFVAFVDCDTGATTIAVDVMRALMTFVNRHCHRFETIISGAV